MTQIVDASDLLSLLTGGAVADLDGYVSRLTGGSSGVPENIVVFKTPRINGADVPNSTSSQWESFWRWDSAPGSFGAIPTTWENPDETWPGGLFQTDEVTAKKRLAVATASSIQLGSLMVYDLLGQIGGLSLAVATAQNINGGSDATTTRYTDGVGNQIWVEIFQLLTSGGNQTITVAYKDTAGASKTTKPVVIGPTGRQEAGRIIKCGLADGGNTVKSVVSAQLSSALGGIGNYGVKIVHPLMCIPISSSSMGEAVGFLNGPFPVIKPDACLGLAFHPRSTGFSRMDAFFQFIENA